MVATIESTKSRKNFIQSVDRALQILEVFLYNDKEMGVTEIAKCVGLNKSTTFGLLCTLENRGYITQNRISGKYQWGFRVIELGFSAYVKLDLVQVVRPYLYELSSRYGETAHLVVLDGDEVVYIDKIQGVDSAVGVISHIGKRNPLYCTGVGKCILAYLDESQIKRYLCNPLERFTDNTITDPTLLLRELENIRRQGYCFDREEIEIGLRCIAAPIKNYTGKVIAAISLSGASVRMNDEKMTDMIIPIKDAARSISKSLGYLEDN